MAGRSLDDETVTLLSKMDPGVAGTLQLMWEQEGMWANESPPAEPVQNDAEEEHRGAAICESGAGEKGKKDAAADHTESDEHVELVDVESQRVKRRKVNTAWMLEVDAGLFIACKNRLYDLLRGKFNCQEYIRKTRSSSKSQDGIDKLMLRAGIGFEDSEQVDNMRKTEKLAQKMLTGQKFAAYHTQK